MEVVAEEMEVVAEEMEVVASASEEKDKEEVEDDVGEDGEVVEEEDSEDSEEEIVDEVTRMRRENLKAVENIIDAEDEELWHPNHGQVVTGPWEFTELKNNRYIHRKAKKVTEDDIFRCNCDVTDGCRDGCQNRDMMIECVDCHLGDACQNMRLQQRDEAPVEVFQTRLKGLGLRAKTRLREGDLIMEYVGDIIDGKEFSNRVKAYEREGTTHFYFMTLQASEMIDATKSGNISRFINHSCSPNAMTQKWTVKGESRIGIYATTDIYQGSEIEFDYQFIRYGETAQQCFCGTPHCRGTIGGKQKNVDTMAQGANYYAENDEDDDDYDEGEDGFGTRSSSSRGGKKAGKKSAKIMADRYAQLLQNPQAATGLSMTERLSMITNEEGALVNKTVVRPFLAILQNANTFPDKIELVSVIPASSSRRAILKRIVDGNVLAVLNRWLGHTPVQIRYHTFFDAVLSALATLPIAPSLLRDSTLQTKIAKLAQADLEEADDLKEKAQALLDSWAKTDGLAGMIVPKAAPKPPPPAPAADTATAMETGPGQGSEGMMGGMEGQMGGPGMEGMEGQMGEQQQQQQQGGGNTFLPTMVQYESVMENKPNRMGMGMSPAGSSSMPGMMQQQFNTALRPPGNDSMFAALDLNSSASSIPAYGGSGGGGGGGGYGGYVPQTRERQRNSGPPSSSQGFMYGGGGGGGGGGGQQQQQSGTRAVTNVEGLGPEAQQRMQAELDSVKRSAQELRVQMMKEAKMEKKRKREADQEEKKQKKAKLLAKAGLADRVMANVGKVAVSSALLELLQDETPLDPFGNSFKERVSTLVMEALRPYRKSKRFASKDDYKHLARKISYTLREKEKERRTNVGSDYYVTTAKLNKRVVGYIDGYFDRHPGVYQRRRA